MSTTSPLIEELIGERAANPDTQLSYGRHKTAAKYANRIPSESYSRFFFNPEKPIHQRFAIFKFLISHARSVSQVIQLPKSGRPGRRTKADACVSPVGQGQTRRADSHARSQLSSNTLKHIFVIQTGWLRVGNTEPRVSIGTTVA